MSSKMRSNFGTVCAAATSSWEQARAHKRLSELDDIISASCRSHAQIDNALRSYLRFTSNYRGRILGAGGAKADAEVVQRNIFRQSMTWHDAPTNCFSLRCSRHTRTTCGGRLSTVFSK